MQKFLLIVSFLIIGTAYSAQVYAQERFPDASHVFESLSPDMQEKILAEVDEAKSLCRDHRIFSAYQDCECIGGKFRDARLSVGPDVSLNNILDEVGTECPNPPAIAKYEYERCVPRTQKNFPFAEESAIDTYCQCVGNDVAKKYEQKPVNSIRYQTQLLVSAQVGCDSAQFRRQ